MINTIKTFQNLKVGDKIYSYYITLLYAAKPENGLFDTTRISEYVVTRTSDNYIYCKTNNGNIIEIKRSPLTVMMWSQHPLDYAIYPISTYNYNNVNINIITRIRQDWQIAIHDYFKQYADKLSHTLYTNLNIKKPKFFINDNIKIVEVPAIEYVEVPVHVKHTTAEYITFE